MFFSETLSPCPDSHEKVPIYTHVAFPHAITFWQRSMQVLSIMRILILCSAVSCRNILPLAVENAYKLQRSDFADLHITFADLYLLCPNMTRNLATGV